MKRILTVAGSDSGGGAGIQADLKAITVLGAHGMSVITALTAQNTVGVRGIQAVPPEFVAEQLDAVLEDIGADGAKTGMLATAAIVEVVADRLARHQVRPLVVDPVMVAKSGDSLLAADARTTIKEKLFPLADVITPNIPEAEYLTGFRISDLDGMKEAARALYDFGPRLVLLKGGHLPDRATDILFDGTDLHVLDFRKLPQKNTHGTGCTLSAALATLLAQEFPPLAAVRQAKQFISRAIQAGINIGQGQGPANPYAHILLLKERETILQELGRGLDLLVAHVKGELIPEVRANFGYALPGALGFSEVAAVPGRISQVGDRLLVSREPAFGASRHIARVILAAMQHDAEMRSAMNIRYSADILEACRKAGLKTASFDRREEPKEVKEKEGSSLEWGTHQALKGLGQIPDLVFDKGDLGKEAMIRILGRTPREVAGKIMQVQSALKT